MGEENLPPSVKRAYRQWGGRRPERTLRNYLDILNCDFDYEDVLEWKDFEEEVLDMTWYDIKESEKYELR